MASSNILGQQSAMTDPKGFMSSSLMFNFEGTPVVLSKVDLLPERVSNRGPRKSEPVRRTVFGERRKELEQAQHASPKPVKQARVISTRGYSSAGRAPALQAGGQRFDPAYLHQCGLIAQLVRASA